MHSFESSIMGTRLVIRNGCLISFLSNKNAIENVHEKKELEKFRLIKKMFSVKVTKL